MCLNLGVTLSYSTMEIQLVLSYLCTVGAPLWSYNALMQRQISLVFPAYFCMYLIDLSVESKAT